MKSVVVAIGCVLASAAIAFPDSSNSAPRDQTVRLQSGSEVGAGLDPLASSEIVHPANLAALAVAVRQAGGLFRADQTGFAIQFNPYMTASGYKQYYEQLTTARESNSVVPWLQDSVVTAFLSPRLPISKQALGGRFVSMGIGTSVELLGTRSVYTKQFSNCLNSNIPEEREAVLRKPPQRRPGASKEATMTYQRAVTAVVDVVNAGINRCQSQLMKRPAIFLSFGARWLAPGPDARDSDKVFVQREFLSISAEHNFCGNQSCGIAAQARALGERSEGSAQVRPLSDAGLDFKYGAQKVTALVFATQVVTKAKDADNQSSIGVSVQARLTESWAFSVGAKGQAENLGRAVHKVSPLLSVSYESLPVIQRALSF